MVLRLTCAVALVLLLAGCSGGGGDDGGDPATPSVTMASTAVHPALNASMPVEALGPFTAHDCQMHAHNVPGQPAESTALLPPGFTATTYQNAPGPTVNLVLFVSHCASAAGSVNLTEFQETLVYLGVDPPDEYEVQGYAYRLVVAAGTDSPGLAALYAKWNITLEDATIATAPAPTAPAYVVDDSVSGPFQLTAHAQLAQQGPAAAGNLRYFYAVDGVLQGVVDRTLSATNMNYVGPVTYTLAGAPLGNGNGGGYAAHYDWAGIDAYVATPVNLPA